MLELLEDGADKYKDIDWKIGRKGAEPGEKISLGEGLYDIIVVDEFSLSLLLDGIDECREKVSNELVEGHSASDACTEANLESPPLLEEGY